MRLMYFIPIRRRTVPIWVNCAPLMNQQKQTDTSSRSVEMVDKRLLSFGII